MTKPIGTDGDVSRGVPYIHQNARRIQAQRTYRRDLISSCRCDAGNVDVPPSQVVQGA
jgi:hypothetical protein